MKKHFILLVLIPILFSFNRLSAQQSLIPQPQEIQVNKGAFSLDKSSKIYAPLAPNEAAYLQAGIKDILNYDIEITDKKPGSSTVLGLNIPFLDRKSKSDITIEIIDTLENIGKEGYELDVASNGIIIKSADTHGAFYGVVTLLQLIEEHKGDKEIPALYISDVPRFSYRGMHLDVCRHFFNVDQVKSYLDYLAAYKINTFHWHLTDDQGWRIEIKSHPRLTEVGAYRKRLPTDGDTHVYQDSLYGGFYTQDQIKEVLDYAEKLHIEVIPEIEMPGHATAALAAYPNLSCTGGPFEVETGWGVFEDIFCPKEETFAFLEDVIDEVIELFPSKYIHIGGDEAPKARWEKCEYCQELIKREGLKDEFELQSYFIKRMERYINSKGKSIIGWDEILEGGLAPNATVMSWTGIEGAIKAAKSGNDAIMTPVSHMYFDYYQGNPQSEPKAFSAELRLERVYSFDPIPHDLTETESKHILGTQANMWTEYIPDFNQVEYMLFPRLMALSEVAWGTSNAADYKGFEKKVIRHFPVLDRKGVNYSKAIYEVSGKIDNKEGKLVYSLSNVYGDKNIYYTIDGSEPTARSLKYSKPIKLDKSMLIKAAYFEGKARRSNILQQEFKISKATGKEITLENPLGKSYSQGGAATLVDGVFGNKNYFVQNWIGIAEKDLIPTIDFGDVVEFSKIRLTLLEQTASWIHYPEGIGVYVSNDNEVFTLVESLSKDQIVEKSGDIYIELPLQSARYLKIIFKNVGQIPEGFPGTGYGAWMFVDEISVD